MSKDLNQTASNIANKVIGETENGGKNPAAVALGRLGGKKGGPARAAKLTAKRRKEIAEKAAKSRWSKTAEVN